MRKIISSLLLFLVVFSSKGQNVGINTNIPHPSAALDITDSTKGILIPRMTMVQRNNIQNPAEGLMVYQTDSTKGYWYWDGALWVNINSNKNQNVNNTGLQNGSTNGQMLYWRDSLWEKVTPGQYGEFLAYCDGVPTWGGCLPKSNTLQVNVLTGSSAVLKGNVISDGGQEVIQRGFCFDTVSNSTIFSGNKIIVGSGIGNFEVVLNNILPNKTYHIKTFATSNRGTSYGNVLNLIITPPLSIGQNYLGGKVFYIDSTGLHGLIAYDNDLQSSTFGCGNETKLTDLSFSIGSGKKNTDSIAFNCSTNEIAARICQEFSHGEFSDWYLPSKVELNLLFQNKDIIGGFQQGSYWSSSENSWSEWVCTPIYMVNPMYWPCNWVTHYYGWSKDFINGNDNSSLKNNVFYVRPIRTF